jgi:hypothetical protein
MSSHDDPEVELTAAERAALAALPREIPPPAALEGRVLTSLQNDKPAPGAWHLGGFRYTGLGAFAALAASVALFCLGLWVGARRVTPPAAPQAGDRYVLLLLEDPGFAPAASENALVAEYREWAVGLRRRGLLELGEKLAEPAILLPEAMATPSRVAGLFILRAKSAAVAAEIARSCPHLRHGGRIELRRIAET